MNTYKKVVVFVGNLILLIGISIALAGCYVPLYSTDVTYNIQNNCSFVDACSYETFADKYGTVLAEFLYANEREWGEVIEWIDNAGTRHVAMLVIYRDETVVDSDPRGVLWGIAGPKRGLPIPLESLKDNIQRTQGDFPVITFINPTSPNYPLADLQELPIDASLIESGQCSACEGNRYWYTVTDEVAVTIHRKSTSN